MDEFERGLNTAKEKFDGFSDKLSKAGETISNVGGTLTKGITLPLAGLGTAVIKTGMDYEAGMSKVQAISGATGDEMTALGEKAMEMAAKTKFSTADSAEAYQYMAMAGWKAGDMVDGLAGIMNLAAASGENLGTTSDIVTDALTAFGLKAGDSGRFADVLAAASNNANTNVSMLGESFKYVAPVAGAMGYSVEDVSVALGLMANSGIKASQAGTSLRTAITNMASPTKNMAAVMEEYGITLTDADGNMLSLSDVMGQLREKMGGLDESTQASAASMLFGKEAMSGMLAIINAAPADFDKLTEAINNSSGTTEEMASIMQNNAAGAFERLKSAIDVLFTQLSSILLPIFTQVVEKITEWVNWFGSLDEGTQRLILTIAGIAAAVGPVLIVIGKIITALTTIGGAISSVVGFVTGGISSILSIGGKLMGGVKALFALLMAHPVVAIVTAIIAAVVLLWNNCEEFRNAIGAIWEAIVGFFAGAWEAIKAAWGNTTEFFAAIWEGIQSIFQGVADFFGGIFQAAVDIVQSVWSAVVDFFSGVWEGIQNVFSTVAEVLGGFFSAAWEAIQAVWSGVTSFFSGVWEGIRGVFSAVADVLGGFFSAAVEAIQSAWGVVVDFFSGIWEGIQGVFSSVAEVLGGFFRSAWEAVQGAWEAAMDFFGGIAEGIHSAFDTVTQFLGDAFSAAWDLIQSVWDSAVSFFQSVWDGISGAFSSAAEWFGDLFSRARSAVEAAWDSITGFFSDTWESIKNVFSDVWEKFKEIGGNIVTGLKDGILNAWSAFTGWLGEKVGGLVDFAKGILGIHSPSKEFAGIGENIVLGLKSGVDGENGAINASMVGVVETMKRAFSNIASIFSEIGSKAVQALTNGFAPAVRKMEAEVSSLMGKIQTASSAVDSLSSKYSSIESKIDQGSYSIKNIDASAVVKSAKSTISGFIPGNKNQSGDTYNFYSPKALDPVSAAREMKKAKQQMALGYV